MDFKSYANTEIVFWPSCPAEDAEQRISTLEDPVKLLNRAYVAKEQRQPLIIDTIYGGKATIDFNEISYVFHVRSVTDYVKV